MSRKVRQPSLFAGPAQFDGDVSGIVKYTTISDGSEPFSVDNDATEQVFILDSTDGAFILLPIQLSKNSRYTFIVRTVPVTNTYLFGIPGSGGQTMVGSLFIASDTTARKRTAPGGAIGVELDGDTQGAAAPGDWLQFVDFDDGGSGEYIVSGFLTANDVIGDPFITV